MPGRVGDFARRVVSFGQGFVDAFLRDNKVIPAVLALLALFVFSWIVAGALLGPPDGERVSNSEEVAQTGQPAGQDPLAPEVENRNADSYAAYRSKDPFRELVAPAPEETTDAPVTSDEPDAAATPTDTTTPSSPSADGDDGGGDDGGGGATAELAEPEGRTIPGHGTRTTTGSRTGGRPRSARTPEIRTPTTTASWTAMTTPTTTGGRIVVPATPRLAAATGPVAQAERAVEVAVPPAGRVEVALGPVAGQAERVEVAQVWAAGSLPAAVAITARPEVS